MNPLIALEFLTVLRVRPSRNKQARQAHGADEIALARSQGFFPLIGLGLGLIAAGLDRGLSEVMPGAPAAALLVVALVILSGGLHLDGLADACDGLFGAYNKDERLEIMRDSRVGSFGVLGVACLLLLKWAAIVSLAWPLRRSALLLAPALGRWAMVSAVAAFPYARSSGLGLTMHREARPYPILLAAAISVSACVLFLGAWGLLAWAFAGACALLLGFFASSKLGGLTGDVYGAIAEICETAFLLFAVTGGERGWLEPLIWQG